MGLAARKARAAQAEALGWNWGWGRLGTLQVLGISSRNQGAARQTPEAKRKAPPPGTGG